jgi:hypothetical protein
MKLLSVIIMLQLNRSWIVTTSLARLAFSRRTDIFGGTLAGWQALLTVHGASILAQRPLLTVDLNRPARHGNAQRGRYRLQEPGR